MSTETIKTLQQNKITKKTLETYKELVKKEQEILEKILKSNKEIQNVYYNEHIIVLQFKPHTLLTNEYLDNLKEFIDYKKYTIEIITIIEEWYKIKTKEQTFQLNLFL